MIGRCLLAGISVDDRDGSAPPPDEFTGILEALFVEAHSSAFVPTMKVLDLLHGRDTGPAAQQEVMTEEEWGTSPAAQAGMRAMMGA